jgi:sec-independent protein translocase protein TatA
MFEGLFQPMHLLVILIVALLIFGPKSLPAIGKGLGEAIRGFKKALNEEEPSSPTSREVVRKEEERKKENDRKMME